MSEPGYRAEQLIIPGLKHFVLETLEPAIGMLTGYERQNPRGEERCFKSANTMRRGCAPYFAALAGAMLELKFGVDPEGEFFTSEKRDRAQRGGDMELFPMLPRGSGGGDSEALRKLMAAAKLRPRDATTYTSLARAVGRAVATKGAAASPSLKDFAIRSWKLAVQLAPARPSALRELAAALRAQGKEQAAERILARVAA